MESKTTFVEGSQSLLSNVMTFRGDRFIDKDPNMLSLIKIGEYIRTPLFEYSIRSMRLNLAEVRKQIVVDRSSNGKFNIAWKAATKMYQMRSAFLKEKFRGPEEYCIALICYTLDEPYRIYDDFNKKCQQLMTDTWIDFPYKGLLYLLIQAEMRMMDFDSVGNQNNGLGGTSPAVRHPITITTDLDYSIDEEKEISRESLPLPTSPVIHTSTPTMKRPMLRVYRGFNFAVSNEEFQPRNLVAFNHLMPTTLDGAKLFTNLQEKSQQGKKTTLVEIDQLSWSSRYVASLSVFPVEKEVIIWPWIKFYVEERIMVGENIERILLKPTSQSFVTFKE